MKGQVARSSAAARRHCQDLRLVERIRAGDVAAFEELYRAYHKSMTRFVANLVRRPALVEEIVNDTMMVAWQKADSFVGASKLSTWMFAIAYRKAMRALSRQDEAIPDPGSESRPSLAPSPEEEASQTRAGLALGQAMQALSEDHRTVVRLTYFHEMDYREIATIMDCPVDTVKTRMFHARRRLRGLLGGTLADWV